MRSTRPTRVALEWPSPQKKEAEFRVATLLLRLQNGRPAPAGTVLPGNKFYTIPGTTSQIFLTNEFFIDGEGTVYAKGRLGLLGEGTYGIATLAENAQGERFVVKEIKPTSYANLTAEQQDARKNKRRQSIQNECDVGKRVGIVQAFYQGDETRNRVDYAGNAVRDDVGNPVVEAPYTLILKYLGQNLFTYLFTLVDNNGRLCARVDTLSMDDRIGLAIKIARCVHELHELGFVHRDIKFENMTIDDHGDIHLIDFGFAGSRTENVCSEVKGTRFMISPRFSDRTPEELDVFALHRLIRTPDRVVIINLNNRDLVEYVYSRTQCRRPCSIFCDNNARELNEYYLNGAYAAHASSQVPFSPVNHYDDRWSADAKYPTALQVYVALLLSKYKFFEFNAYGVGRQKLLSILPVLAPSGGDVLDRNRMRREIQRIIFFVSAPSVGVGAAQTGPGVVMSKFLFLAIEGNNLAAVQEMLRQGADFTMKNEQNETPIQYAARLQHHAIVASLMMFSVLPASSVQNDPAAGGGALVGSAAAVVAPQQQQAVATSAANNAVGLFRDRNRNDSSSNSSSISYVSVSSSACSTP